jgi:hypothetical protein
VEGGSPRREGEKVRISGKALAQVSAARQEYLDKIEAHTDCGKLVLNLDKMLEEKRVDLDEREQDLELRSTHWQRRRPGGSTLGISTMS